MTTGAKPRPRSTNGNATPTAPSTLQRWFPVGVWLREYEWGKFTAPDLIAAVSIAALLIPESMGTGPWPAFPPRSACTRRRWR